MALPAHARLFDDAERTAFARWALRFALFGLTLLVITIILHRFFDMKTPLALNLIALVFASETAALVLAGLAVMLIWRRAMLGLPDVVVAIAIALAVFAWPALYAVTFFSLPQINDLTTDPSNPPAFQNLVNLRDPRANSGAYPGFDAARAQIEAYPDIRPIVVDRSPEDVYELARLTARSLRWQIVRNDPPRGDGRGAAAGYLQAVDRTLVLGLRDDIVIRVLPVDGGGARIDFRSASRYGLHDFAQNAARLRTFSKSYTARLQASVSRPDRAAPKPGKRRQRKRRRRN
ncbi:MAG: DUF1499 domain-containing protein [Pseudomonadota bacterium]